MRLVRAQVQKPTTHMDSHPDDVVHKAATCLVQCDGALPWIVNIKLTMSAVTEKTGTGSNADTFNASLVAATPFNPNHNTPRKVERGCGSIWEKAWAQGTW